MLSRLYPPGRRNMPEYFSSDHWHYCSVKVKPVGWRKIPFLKQYLPVFVGGKLKFKLVILRQNEQADKLEDICVYEILPDAKFEKTVLLHNAKVTNGKLIAVVDNASKITRSGQVEYRLGKKPPHVSTEYVIASSPIVYKEIPIRTLTMMIMSAFLGALLQWLFTR